MTKRKLTWWMIDIPVILVLLVCVLGFMLYDLGHIPNGMGLRVSFLVAVVGGYIGSLIRKIANREQNRDDKASIESKIAKIRRSTSERKNDDEGDEA